MATQVQESDGFDRNVGDEEMMTLGYDLEPVTNDTEAVESNEHKEALDAMATQVTGEVDRSRANGAKRGSSETASQSSVAATQVFSSCDGVRSESQPDVVTQTFPASSRQPDSQTDFLATQVFEPVTLTPRNSGGQLSANSRSSGLQGSPGTRVVDAGRTVQRMSDGSPSVTSPLSKSQTDIVPTQMFSEPVAVARSGSSPQQPTQTISAPGRSPRTSDGTRVSFSPQSCSTQVFTGETDFPHLQLEMSECNDSHEDAGAVITTATRRSLQQVFPSSLCLF